MYTNDWNGIKEMIRRVGLGRRKKPSQAFGILMNLGSEAN